MAASRNVLLLTGTPGIGKTTLVKKIVQSFPDRRLTGFYTEEIRAAGGRQGFALVTLQGKRFIMAHVDRASAPRVSRYGVDVQAIDRGVAAALAEERSPELFIVDEIGKMECFSEFFGQWISSLLDSGKPVVATIAGKGGGLIAEVKKREGVELWEVTRKNRNELAGRVAAWLKERLP